MKWRNSKERELLANGGSRDQTLPNKNNPNPDLSDARCDQKRLISPSASPANISCSPTLVQDNKDEKQMMNQMHQNVSHQYELQQSNKVHNKRLNEQQMELQQTLLQRCNNNDAFLNLDVSGVLQQHYELNKTSLLYSESSLKLKKTAHNEILNNGLKIENSTEISNSIDFKSLEQSQNNVDDLRYLHQNQEIIHINCYDETEYLSTNDSDEEISVT